MKKIFSLLLLLTSSCTLHPPYCRPTEEIPTVWRIPTEEITPCEENLCWWQQLGDLQLDLLICYALEQNQDIKVAIYRVEEFVAKLQITNSEFYPQINAEVSAVREKTPTNIPLIPGQSQFNLYNLVFNGSYFLDFFGRVRSASEASLAELCAQIENRRTVVLTIVSAVASTYIRLRQFDKQLLVSTETLASRLESLHLAQVRFELGLTSELQVEQAIAEVQDAETTIKQIEISIALEEDLLSILIGEPPTSIERGKDLDSLAMPVSVPAFLPSDLLNQRPDILAAEQQLIGANARIGVAKALFFPQISLTGSYGRESLELKNLLSSSSSIWQYGFTLLQEIFTGGKLTGQLKLARAEKERLVHNYQSTILTAFREVNDALISHHINLELVQVQKKKVDTLKEYLRLSTLRYTEGETDYLTVLDAQRRLFLAELDYAQIQGDSFTTLVSIYQSLGGGWAVNADTYAEESN